MQILDRKTRIEWRADTIGDPVAKLRYLRAQTKHLSCSPDSETGPIARLNNRGSVALAGLIVMGMLLASGYAAARIGAVPEIKPVILPPPVYVSALRTQPPAGVWIVEKSDEAETYSNGLRIENGFAVSNIPRTPYKVYSVNAADRSHALLRDNPAGIVFHTTESNLAPFVAGQNRNLQRISVEVLNFVRSNRSYHFLIDRFGRVFRVVRESDVAFHAGHSTWADEHHVYVNLNSAFLGIALETQTHAGADLPTATPAQISAARVLTEMLRCKYNIAASSCVTHAQVSINPFNMLIGYHTDWAGNFPFTEMGLDDNYREPPAGIWAFGFHADPAYVQSTGLRLLPGLQLAESRLAAGAARLKITPEQYRSSLQRNYKEISAGAAAGDSAKEKAHE